MMPSSSFCRILFPKPETFVACEATDFMVIRFFNKAWPAIAIERWEGGQNERGEWEFGGSGISQMVHSITWSPQRDYIAL